MSYQVYRQVSLLNHVSSTFSINLVHTISYSISDSSSFYLSLTVLVHPLSVPGTFRLCQYSGIPLLCPVAGQYLLADPEVYSNQMMLIIPPGGFLCEGVAKLLPPVALTPLPRLSPNHPKEKIWDWGWALHHQLTAVSVRGHYCCHCTKPPANSLFTLQPLMQKMPAYPPSFT